MNYPIEAELELEKATKRLRWARLEYEYAESIFRVRERIELYLAVRRHARVQIEDSGYYYIEVLGGGRKLDNTDADLYLKLREAMSDAGER